MGFICVNWVSAAEPDVQTTPIGIARRRCGSCFFDDLLFRFCKRLSTNNEFCPLKRNARIGSNAGDSSRVAGRASNTADFLLALLTLHPMYDSFGFVGFNKFWFGKARTEVSGRKHQELRGEIMIDA